MPPPIFPPYTTITSAMQWKVKQVPAGTAHAAAAIDVSEVEGLVSQSDILADEQILPATLKALGNSEGGLSYIIPEGMRAFTIAVSETTGVAWFLRRGDIVDVFADLADAPFEEEGRSNGHVAVLLVEGCELAAVGITTEAVSGTSDFTVRLAACTRRRPAPHLCDQRGRSNWLCGVSTTTPISSLAK